MGGQGRGGRPRHGQPRLILPVHTVFKEILVMLCVCIDKLAMLEGKIRLL